MLRILQKLKNIKIRKIQRTIGKILSLLLLVVMLWIPSLAHAQSDPLVTTFSVLDDSPAPTEEVDFILTYGNKGSTIANDVELVIDYNETQLENISLGDPEHCMDSGISVRCFFEEIPGNSTHSVGFTARVIPTVTPGTVVRTIASIEEFGNPNDDIRNNFNDVVLTISAPTGAAAAALAGLPIALETGEATLEEPSSNQGIVIFDVQNNPNWQISSLSTVGLKFMIRGKEALAWSLNIEDSGFHNPAIRSSYLKVLTVINSLFIIGLLAIAGMWMFSILIPRRYLRQVVLIYGLAVIFVNFALPLNQLFIDGTNLLQKTFLDGVNIASIVETPNYNDENAIAYQNKADFLSQSVTKKLDLNLANMEEGAIDIRIGKIERDFLSPTLTGSIQTADGLESIDLRAAGSDHILKLDASQSIELVDEKLFNPNQEHSIFAFLMMLFTGIAYLGMALIFILRIVLLWALMIVSPALFLLAIFHATRSYFYSWLGTYARWLLIGPLMALGIAIVVNIWKSVGLPITSSYAGFGQFGTATNIGFYLPGKEMINNLNTTPQMMEYFLFLIMLYLPIFFAFILTRQKLWSAAATTVLEKREAARATQASIPAETTVTEKTKEKEGVEQVKGLAGGIKGFLGSKFAGLAKGAGVPESMRSGEAKGAAPVETAHSYLPEHLALSKVGDMLDLAAGDAKGTRNEHAKAIEKLAAPDQITDPKERENIMTIRDAITEKAEKGDAEATRIVTEIQQQETTMKESGQISGGATGITPTVEVTVSPEAEAKSPEVDIGQLKSDVKKDDREKPDEEEGDESSESGEEDLDPETIPDQSPAQGSGEDSEERTSRKKRHASDNEPEKEEPPNETDNEE